jgi:hypothetical protein
LKATRKAYPVKLRTYITFTDKYKAYNFERYLSKIPVECLQKGIYIEVNNKPFTIYFVGVFLFGAKLAPGFEGKSWRELPLNISENIGKKETLLSERRTNDTIFSDVMMHNIKCNYVNLLCY